MTDLACCTAVSLYGWHDAQCPRRERTDPALDAQWDRLREGWAELGLDAGLDTYADPGG